MGPQQHTFTIEVVKESRALIEIDASNYQEASDKAKSLLESGQAQWNIENRWSDELIAAKKK